MRVHTYPVAANSVYVWRGFKSTKQNYTYQAFEQFLATVFVPACALLQPRIGLRAYLPSMVPQANKPPEVPDQTALMFWATPLAHDDAKKALAERIYTNLHGDVYDMDRSKLQEVPKSIDSAGGTLEAEQPYYLCDRPTDWMLGGVHHLVGGRRPDLEANDFLTRTATWARAFRERPPTGVDGALVCCGNDYAVAWVHGSRNGRRLRSALDGLAELTMTVLRDDARRLQVGAELWDDWPGLIDLTKHACINIQLHRARNAKPQKRRAQ